MSISEFLGKKCSLFAKTEGGLLYHAKNASAF